MKNLFIKKYNTKIILIILTIILITIFLLLYNIISLKQGKNNSINLEKFKDQNKIGNEWFFLPQYCFDNNCLTANNKSNEMSIDFPNNVTEEEFEPQQRCTAENCITVVLSKVLFDFYGITHLEGYYIYDLDNKYNSETDNTQSKKCDKFKIQKGNKTVVSFLQFFALKNSQGTENNTNLPVNIDISLLSDEQKKILINSNIDNQVKIIVHKSYSPSQDIDLCFSFIKVINVKKI